MHIGNDVQRLMCLQGYLLSTTRHKYWYLPNIEQYHNGETIIPRLFAHDEKNTRCNLEHSFYLMTSSTKGNLNVKNCKILCACASNKKIEDEIQGPHSQGLLKRGSQPPFKMTYKSRQTTHTAYIAPAHV